MFYLCEILTVVKIFVGYLELTFVCFSNIYLFSLLNGHLLIDTPSLFTTQMLHWTVITYMMHYQCVLNGIFPISTLFGQLLDDVTRR